jgi:hypothetical protein
LDPEDLPLTSIDHYINYIPIKSYIPFNPIESPLKYTRLLEYTHLKGHKKSPKRVPWLALQLQALALWSFFGSLKQQLDQEMPSKPEKGIRVREKKSQRPGGWGEIGDPLGPMSSPLLWVVYTVYTIPQINGSFYGLPHYRIY